MSSELALKKLDEVAKQGSELTRSIQASFSGALRVAQVAKAVRDALTIEVVQEFIVPLMECDFGWRTDRTDGTKQPYTLQQIRDVWVSAAMVGAVPVNNEVNMIAGRLYLAKNYFTRQLRDYPGLTDFVAMPGKLTMAPNGALVEYTATWKLNGKDMSLARTGGSAIPVRLNAGMGADGAIGKAERKLKAAVFSMLTGSTLTEDSDEMEELVSSPSSNQMTTTHATINQQQTLPEPEKATQTQTQVVKDKIKKSKPQESIQTPQATPAAAQRAVEQSKPAVDASAPWADDGEEQQATTAPAAQGSTPVSEPIPDDKKVVGWVKDAVTGEMKPITKEENHAAEKKSKKTQAAPAAQQTAPTETPPVQEQKSEDVVETDHIGIVASIRAKGKDAKGVSLPPYTITSENGTQYVTEDVKIAQKTSEWKKNNVPVTIEYTVAPSGKHIIVEVRPEDKSETPPQDDNDFGAE